VPGCETNGKVESKMDYCIDPSALKGDDGQGALPPTASPSRPHVDRSNTAAPTFPGEMLLGNTPSGALFSDEWEMVFEVITPPAVAPPSSTINNAMKHIPTATPTFEFRGPPVSLAPTSEAWVIFEKNRFDTLPLMYTGNDGDFDGPYPLLNCQGDCDTDDDVSLDALKSEDDGNA
jgi:hypothetical protein